MRASGILPFLQSAMQEGEITTPARTAAFLAQIGHESGSFRFMEEIWGPTEAQLRYERPDGAALSSDLSKAPLWQRLGNTEKGDGRRYAGRGVLQLTGRSNYRTAGAALRLDLEGSPEQAARPDVGFRIAAWYWTRHHLNALADAGNFDAITKKVNGGFNGKPDRDKRHALARKALGL